MKRPTLIPAAIVTTAVPASASAGGNIANGSIGTTQVGSTASAPQASADGTTITVPISIVGTGGNTSNHSIGTAQVGAVDRDDPARRRPLDAGLTRPCASERPERAAERRREQGDGLVQVGAPGHKSVVLLLGPPKPREHVAAQLTRDFTFDPANLLFQATAAGVRPDVLAAVDPIAALTFGGTIGTGPNGGNSAPDSTDTAQVGSVTIAPVIGIDSSAFGSGATAGGSNTVDGAGTNLADPSIGTVQAGGSNTSKNSNGTPGGRSVARPGSRADRAVRRGSARRLEWHRRRIE